MDGGNLKVMHELSLTQTLLELAIKNADGKRIVAVNLLLGEFSDERPEAIRFYWEDIAKGTNAEGAELKFRPVEAEMKCLDCESVFHPNVEAAECPNCKSFRVKLLSGDDVRLESIDVE
jgi:hydrogenase nickel incorporation protein HypA/HybF